MTPMRPSGLAFPPPPTTPPAGKTLTRTPATSTPRQLEVVVVAQWIGVLAGVGATLSIVWPEAARPIFSLVVGVVLVGVVVVAVRSMLNRLPHPHADSPFDRSRRADDALLPSELLRIANAIGPVRPNRSLPDSVIWTLRRIAIDRLVQRHGRRVPDTHRGAGDIDITWLVPLVSPALLCILRDDIDRRGIPARALVDLITEIEQL